MTSDAKHVVVIGAGIVGVSSAIWLLRQGHRVTLIDRSEPGEGTSYGNAGLLASAATLPVTTPGLLRKAPYLALNPKQPLFLNWRKLPGVLPWLTQYIRHANAKDAKFRAAAILPLIGDSLNDHQALAKGTGAEDWIVPCDYVYGYTSRAAFLADHFSWSIRRESGFSFSELDGPAFRAYDPIYSDAIGHAAVLANHGRIRDPGRYVKTLAKHAEKQGASVIKAEVNDVAKESGRVSGVRVGGEIIDCDAMVLTAGVWSKNLAEKLKLHVPLQAESGFHLELWEPSVMPRSPVMVSQGKFVITPMDGRIRLAGMTGYGRFGSEPPEAPYRLFEAHLKRVIPDLSYKYTQRWMGHRPSIVDSLPLIGEVPGVRGAFVGFGHDHVGLTGGPKTGWIIAQLVSGKRLNDDLSAFKPDRFS